MADTIRKRIVVILLVIPGLLAMIVLGGYWFTLLVTVIMLIGLFEWRNILSQLGTRILVIPLLLAVCLQSLSFTRFKILDQGEILLLLGLTLALVEMFRNNKTHILNISGTLFGFIWLGWFIGSMVLLRNYEAGGYNVGYQLTMAMFVTVWITDSAAYLMGKNFGKRKIMPSVSPNKTWMGCVSGVIAAIITMLVFYYASGILHNFLNIADTIALALIFGIVGQAGDFAESLLKREAKIKDTGSFLMGHGGVLDRFDSLAFTAPLTYIYATYFII